MKNAPKNAPKAPAGLGPQAKKFWSDVCEVYELESHHRHLLGQACVQLDRAKQAQNLVAAEGIVVKDRFGQGRENPACAVERAAALTFMRLVREMGLDVQPPAEIRTPRLVGRGA